MEASFFTEQGNIFAVRYTCGIAAAPGTDAMSSADCTRNTQAARHVVRHCDALYETFLRGVRSAVHGSHSLFGDGAEASLLIADEGAEKLCCDLCMSLTARQADEGEEQGSVSPV